MPKEAVSIDSWLVRKSDIVTVTLKPCIHHMFQISSFSSCIDKVTRLQTEFE